MWKKTTPSDRFGELTWDDIEIWAGATIVSRGRNYQRQGRVTDLAVMDDGSLLAWVNGSERYATKVVMGEDGRPDSICTCPYGSDCKHAVAVVLEYRNRVDHNRSIPKAKQDDKRLQLLDWGTEPHAAENVMAADLRQDLDDLLKNQTKNQLMDLIFDLAGRYPEVARELTDRKQLLSGNIKTLVTRLRQEINDLGKEPGWQDYWRNEGYTPDYSRVRTKLEALLKAGHTDEVLALGRQLVTTGLSQVEESHDEGETAMEVANCLPVIVEALERSSLETVDKLTWALDAWLEDDFEVCEAFADYLHRRHPQQAWHTFADRLLGRLTGLKGGRGADDFSRRYERDRLSDWAIYALEQAGREAEIIPLCVVEAQTTGNYERLVKRLMAAERYEEAVQWIHKGIQDLGGKWPGITAKLREKMREIRTLEQNWPVVAAIQVEDFVRQPSRQAFTACQQACDRATVWPQVRAALLTYLERGELPWKQPGWILPVSGLARPDVDKRHRFPLLDVLIGIAIEEKKPAEVLHWYDQCPQDHGGWFAIDEDAIATAVQDQAPERAIAIWQKRAERLITQVQPRAYEEAARYLKKVGKVMTKKKQQVQWAQYLGRLRQSHARKRRLVEILDGLEQKPVMKKSR